MTTTLQQPQVKTIHLEDGWNFNLLTPYMGTITKGKVRQTSYFGFLSRKEAEKFARALVEKSIATEAQPRASERLETSFEVKAWGVSTEFLVKMANLYPNKIPTTAV